ncbi:Bacterial transcription activator, effector binding domain [compost metagenome]
MKHRIVELPAFCVIGMEYVGTTPNDSLGLLWQRFLPREEEIFPRLEPRVAYGICSQAPTGELHYVAGIRVPDSASLPEGMVKFAVPAQKYAVFTHHGTVEQIADSFQAIYSELLARLGLEPKSGVDFERYDERFTGPDDPAAEVDLYIPIY